MANEDTSIAMLNEILIPCIERKRKELNLQSKPWLLICGIFKDQWSDAVKELLKYLMAKWLSFQTIGQTTSNHLI